MSKITVSIEKTEQGYSAYIRNLNGVVAFAETLPKVKKEIKSVLKQYLEWCKEDYDTIPKDFEKYSLEFKLEIGTRKTLTFAKNDKSIDVPFQIKEVK